MMRVVAAAGLLVLLGATAGVAERNLIPTLDNRPDVCSEQSPDRSLHRKGRARASANMPMTEAGMRHRCARVLQAPLNPTDLPS